MALAIRSALAASVAIAVMAPGAALAQSRAASVHDLTRNAAAAPPVSQTDPGDIHVVNTDDIATTGATDVAAISVEAGGLASVENSGALTATSSGATADGIFATGLDVDVYNTGDISVQGDLWGAGIEAQGYSTTTVNNTGAMDVVANGYAFGITATGGPGSVSVTNSGVLNVSGYYATGIDVAAGTDAYVRNDGAINAGVDGAAVATGVHVTSQYDGGAITVINTGDVASSAYYVATGIEVSGSGAGSTADITNVGNVVATTVSNYFTATGIAASADGDSTITNLGFVSATGGGDSEGLVSTAFGGVASIVNGGDVVVTSDGGYATGVAAVSNGGLASIDNQGNVLAYGADRAYGVNAQGLYGTSVNNDGTIYATAGGAYAVQALSGLGDIQVVNGTDGQIIGYGSVGVGVFAVASQGDIALDNAGLVAGVGAGPIGVGAFLRANAGDVGVANTGTIEGLSNSDALGLRAIADAGDVQVVNGGTVIASSGYGDATALEADAFGTAAISSTGTVNATAYAGNAYGVVGTGAAVGIVSNGDVTADAAQGVAIGLYGNGDAVQIANGGSIGASGAFGIGAYASGVTSATILNTGSISAAGTYAIGVGGKSQGSLAIENRGGTVGTLGDVSSIGFTLQADGDASLLNTGTVHVDATGDAVGAQVVAYGAAIVENRSGSMHVSGAGTSTGLVSVAYGADTVINGTTLRVDSSDGSATGIVANGFSTVGVRNAGTLTVDGATDATGIVAVGDGATTVLNTGSIASTATDGEAIGIVAASGAGLTVDNRGTITATNDTSAVAVDFASAGTLLNSGTLQALSSLDGALAVRGDTGVQDVRNGGTVLGALVTGAGDDRFTNLAGGTWFVDGAATDFGTGDDVLTNNAGGTITFRDGEVHLGSSTTGNTFSNLGTVRVQGTGLIDMGTGATASTANARAFSNGGLIDMVDGATDDTLTIDGDLGGTGRLAIDMALTGSAADHLVVNGNVATGAQQTVDLRFSGLPTSTIAPVEFARVSGTSTASSFVGGTILGYDPKDFLDLRVAVTSSISTANTTPDIFSVGLDVAGLNAPGALAANAAAGAQSLMATGIGSWRDRMGLDPSRDGRVGLGLWVRSFADRGRLAPTNTGATMGSAGDLRIDQANHGHEFGTDVYFGRGIHAGLLFGEADGRQTLRNGGGTDRLHADTSGVYGTWFGANGTYIDASYRWLAFDARIDTSAGVQHTRGDGHAANIEAGFGGLTFAGFRATPQVQFTQSRVGRLTVNGSQATFTTGGSTSNRARVGLEFSRDFGLGAWSLTPYGAISAVHEFDGRSRYSVNGLFNGETSIEGTSALVDLGVAAQYRGLVFGTGVQWTDGGALEDFVGGQLVLRYTW